MIRIGALNLVARIPGGHCLLLCGSCSQGDGGVSLSLALVRDFLVSGHFL